MTKNIFFILCTSTLIGVLFFYSYYNTPLPAKKDRRTAIVIFKGFKGLNETEIKSTIQNTYGFKVDIIDTLSYPNHAFINVKSPRYRADSLILFLKKIKPIEYYNIIGLCSQDISITKRSSDGTIKSPEWKYSDFGVFGLGYRPGSSAVLSNFRLTKNKALKKEQLKKILLHEMGHNLGLKHCTSLEKCLMQDAAEKLQTINLVPLALCKDCSEYLNL